MRENRTSGSEGGGTETNRSFLPLSRHFQLEHDHIDRHCGFVNNL